MPSNTTTANTSPTLNGLQGNQASIPPLVLPPSAFPYTQTQSFSMLFPTQAQDVSIPLFLLPSSVFQNINISAEAFPIFSASIPQEQLTPTTQLAPVSSSTDICPSLPQNSLSFFCPSATETSSAKSTSSDDQLNLVNSPY